jgi:ribulose-5-phosphate 4-epimerase/fuculose-1-phosphate aldolase
MTANIIHDALYAANPETNAVAHLHSPAAVAVSCLSEGFLFLDQNVRPPPPLHPWHSLS